MVKSKLVVCFLPLMMASLVSCGGGNNSSSTTLSTDSTTQTTGDQKIFVPQFEIDAKKAILTLRVSENESINEFRFYKLDDQFASIEICPSQNKILYNYFLKKTGSDKYTGYSYETTGTVIGNVDWEEIGEIGAEKDVILTGLNYLYNVPSNEYLSVDEERISLGIQTTEDRPVSYGETSLKYTYSSGISFNYCDMRATSVYPMMTFVQKRTSNSEKFTAEVISVNVYQPNAKFPTNIPTVE